MHMQSMMEDDDGYIIRIRGLPWSASHEEIMSFLEGVNILNGKGGVHFTFVRDGRPSGEAYIELESEEDLEKALTKDKHHMGKRYIDVFRSKRSEMDWVVKRSGPQAQNTGAESVVRLRGLPFGCSKEEIAHFFTGLEIVPNGITLLQDAQGRTTGDAFVQFSSPDLVETALEKHKERIGHRYIEIFKSSAMEVRNAMSMMNRMGGGMNRMGGGGGGMGNRPGPYDRNERFVGGGGGMGGGGGGPMGFRGRGRGNIKGFFDDGYDDFGGGYGNARGGMRSGGMGGVGGGRMKGGFGRGGGRGGGGGGGGGGGSTNYSEMYESTTGHCVHMRGLPFAATEQDILEFFSPLNPVNIYIHIQSDGRASGEADVDFATHEEAKESMAKDKEKMQHRYIELFLKSTPGGYSGDGGGGRGGGMGGTRGGGMGRRMGGGIGLTLSDITDFSEDDDYSFGGMGAASAGGGVMSRMNRMGKITPMGLMNKGAGAIGNKMGGGMGGDMMGGQGEQGFGMGSSFGRGNFNGDGAMKRGNNFGGGFGMGGNPHYTPF